MAQVTGIIFAHVNGKLLRVKEGAKLNTGGKERTAQTGHKVYGYSEKIVPAQFEGTIAHTADTDIDEMNGYVGATVTFECDSGVSYLMANAFTTKPCELTGGDGDLTLEMQGDPALEQ